MTETYIRYECAHCGWLRDFPDANSPKDPPHYIDCQECGKLTMPFEIISIGSADE